MSTRNHLWRRPLATGIIALLLTLVVLAVGCSTASPANNRPTAPSPSLTSTQTPTETITQTLAATTKTLSEFETVQKAALTYFGAGKPLVVTADGLWKTLNDGDRTNDPFIVSVRAAADYANGHIPGAINIPLAEIFKPESLAKIPKDTQIVTYCYTGNTAQIAASFLNLMGYNAVSLKYSMMAWTKNPAVQDPAKYNWDPAKGNDLKIAAEATMASAKNILPTLATAGKDAAEIMRLASEQAFARVKTHTVASADVFKNLNDGDTSNDPFMVDMRKAEDYAKGHVAGAVNMIAADIFKSENLEKLPADKQIVVNCYTGQTSQLVATALRTLGYNAASLKFGIMDWSKNDALLGANKRWSPDTEQWDFPTEK